MWSTFSVAIDRDREIRNSLMLSLLFSWNLKKFSFLICAICFNLYYKFIANFSKNWMLRSKISSKTRTPPLWFFVKDGLVPTVKTFFKVKFGKNRKTFLKINGPFLQWKTTISLKIKFRETNTSSQCTG